MVQRARLLPHGNGLRKQGALPHSVSLDHTPVYPREVVKRALELSATAVILGTTIPLGANNPVGSRSIRLKHWIFDLP